MQYVISTFHVILKSISTCAPNESKGARYCRPIKEAVSSAMRILSVEPLMDGVPAHCEAAGIFPFPFHSMNECRAGRVIARAIGRSGCGAAWQLHWALTIRNVATRCRETTRSTRG